MKGQCDGRLDQADALRAPLDVARDELFASLLRADLLRSFPPYSVVLQDIVDGTVDAHLRRKGIHVDPIARRDLINTLIERLGNRAQPASEKGGSRHEPKRTEYPVRRPLKRPPVHPGALMREILEDHAKLTVSEAARRMKVSRPALYAVLNGTAAVSAEMALRFARLTGGAPELYLNMQTGYDLEAAEERLQDELVEIHPSNPKSSRVSPTRLAGFRREMPAAALPRRKRALG